MEGRTEVKAIIFGVLAYMAVAFVVGALAVMALHNRLILQMVNEITAAGAGATPTMMAQQQLKLQAAMSSTPALIMNLVVGFLSLVVGGYVAAHHARGSEKKNALALGTGFTILSALTLVMLLTSPQLRQNSPMWPHLATMLLSIPATMLGGSLRASASRDGDAPPSDIR